MTARAFRPIRPFSALRLIRTAPTTSAMSRDLLPGAPVLPAAAGSRRSAPNAHLLPGPARDRGRGTGSNTRQDRKRAGEPRRSVRDFFLARSGGRRMMVTGSYGRDARLLASARAAPAQSFFCDAARLIGAAGPPGRQGTGAVVFSLLITRKQAEQVVQRAEAGRAIRSSRKISFGRTGRTRCGARTPSPGGRACVPVSSPVRAHAPAGEGRRRTGRAP